MKFVAVVDPQKFQKKKILNKKKKEERNELEIPFLEHKIMVLGVPYSSTPIGKNAGKSGL
jgi:hypothetical protein